MVVSLLHNSQRAHAVLLINDSQLAIAIIYQRTRNNFFRYILCKLTYNFSSSQKIQKAVED
jgi:hypothetical protein